MKNVINGEDHNPRKRHQEMLPSYVKVVNGAKFNAVVIYIKIGQSEIVLSKNLGECH